MGVASTVGAGKSAPGDRERVGIDSKAVWWAMGLGCAVFFPAALLVYALWSGIGQWRKVRVSRMFAWAGFGLVVSLMALLLTGGNIVIIHIQGWLSMLNIGNWVGMALTVIAQTLKITLPALPPPMNPVVGFFAQVPLSMFPATLMAAINSVWKRARTEALRELEGEQFNTARPFGIIDWVRLRRVTHQIQSGAGTDPKRGLVAVGAGRYGHLIQLPIAELQIPTLVLGRPRTGKTSLGCSLLGQAAEGGVLVLDFKGDKEVPEYWARWALARNRKFKHFTTTSTGRATGSTEAYRPPTEGAPDRPACYDPMRYGNPDSKTSMLQKSVDREGDAAAYLRAASEFTLVAYQIAAITERDRGRSGFQVLHDLCDLAELEKALSARDPETGAYYLNNNNPQHVSLRLRVKEMAEKVRKDPLLAAAIASTKQLLSGYMHSAAVGPWLRPGDTIDNDIDLLRAVVEGHVVVFSLPTQDYAELCRTIGTLVTLDLANVISALRIRRENNRQAGSALDNDGMDWKPFYFQVEEFGSAGSEAVLSVLNKCGDVEVRPLLSSQSWNDLVETMGEINAKRIVEQAGNMFAFALNDDDGPEQISAMTEIVAKSYPRMRKQFSAGWFGIDVKAANTGDIETTRENERQLTSSDIQTLGRDRRWNKRSSHRRVFEFIWWAGYDGNRVTHTFIPYANNWFERVRSILCPPDVAVRRELIHDDVPDQALAVAADERERAAYAAQLAGLNEGDVVGPAVAQPEDVPLPFDDIDPFNPEPVRAPAPAPKHPQQPNPTRNRGQRGRSLTPTPPSPPPQQQPNGTSQSAPPPQQHPQGPPPGLHRPQRAHHRPQTGAPAAAPKDRDGWHGIGFDPAQSEQRQEANTPPAPPPPPGHGRRDGNPPQEEDPFTI